MGQRTVVTAVIMVLGVAALAGTVSAATMMERYEQYAIARYGSLESAEAQAYLDSLRGRLEYYAERSMDYYQDYYQDYYENNGLDARIALQMKADQLAASYGVDVNNPLGSPTSEEWDSRIAVTAQKELDREIKEYGRSYGEDSYLTKKYGEDREAYYEETYGVDVVNSKGAPTESDKSAFAEQLDKQLEQLKKYYEQWYGEGSELARRAIENMRSYYEKYYGLELSNPYEQEEALREQEEERRKLELTDQYNRRLEELVDYLLGIGMSTEDVLAKVQATKDWYEKTYSLQLTTPEVTGTGSEAALAKAESEELSEQIWVKESIRRLGGIITNERPVSTYIGDNYKVQAGFLRGASIFDRKLLFLPPTGFPERKSIKKLATVTKEVIK